MSKRKQIQKLKTGEETSLPPCEPNKKEAAVSLWLGKQNQKKNSLSRRRSLTNLDEEQQLPKSMMNWKTSPYQAQYVTTDENFNKNPDVETLAQ